MAIRGEPILAAGGKMLKKLGKVSRLRNSSSEVGEYDICRREREGERERERERKRERGRGRERKEKKRDRGGRDKQYHL